MFKREIEEPRKSFAQFVTILLAIGFLGVSGAFIKQQNQLDEAMRDVRKLRAQVDDLEVGMRNTGRIEVEPFRVCGARSTIPKATGQSSIGE